MKKIPVAGPWITEKEIQYVSDAAANAWYEGANSFHEKFEAAFAAHVDRRYAMAMPSCTAALHTALAGLGVGPGDEVIVPDITWVATAAPACYLGASVVFADIDEDSWCLSSKSFKQCITAKTKAVIPVDLYGNMPNMGEILSIASEHNVAVVEDSAQAIGSQYDGRNAGSFGDLSVFSFHGSKTLTCGEGGILVTDDERLYKRCGILRDHGRVPGESSFWNYEIAFKYKMSSFQAAFALGQLERLTELVERKRQIFRWYQERLEDCELLALNSEREHVKNSYWMVTVVLDSGLQIPKEELMTYLSSKAIDSRPFFHPLSSLPAFAHSPESAKAKARNVTSYKLSPYGINLPTALSLTEEDVDRVCSVLKEALTILRK